MCILPERSIAQHVMHVGIGCGRIVLCLMSCSFLEHGEQVQSRLSEEITFT